MFEIEFTPKILKKYFDIAVIEECRYCKRYSFKNCCPPMVPDINYFKKLLPTYKNGLIIYNKFEIFDFKEWESIGKQSSLDIHHYLLNKRNELIQKGTVFGVAFTAGSCKLCAKCTTPCNHPDQMLIPIEGTGINVIKLMKRFKILINFPIEKQGYFFRIGMLLWK